DIQAQIAGLDDQVANSGRQLERLRAGLDSPNSEVQRVSTSNARSRRAEAEIIRVLDSIHRAKYIREVKASELEHRKVQRQKLADSLHEMKDKREALISR